MAAVGTTYVHRNLKPHSLVRASHTQTPHCEILGSQVVSTKPLTHSIIKVPNEIGHVSLPPTSLYYSGEISFDLIITN